MTKVSRPPGPVREQGAAPDGRSVRWERHREERRASLVDATIRAIRRHGATVGMDDIAAEAGTSKTVIYRHFEDRAGLYRAVAQRVEARVVGGIARALEQSTGVGKDPRELISSTVNAYLELVESDSELYRFVVNRPIVDRPLTDDPVGELVSHVTDQLTHLLEGRLGGSDGRPFDPATTRVWAVALVGSVQAVGDDWLAAPARPGRPTRGELVQSLTDLAWSGLAPSLSDRESRSTAR
ncbi:TetR/AcrR family transcriptional regulator [Intrasporangium calvum]|uniref:TetR/AcrR family transcriptional regulator n=1 Tax=Intrasporangium calvum TaxID=53358 RepID=A0ABT5GBS1_9MICO|nr:TetR/AcrR family transcriptional regulator [Intrasporangium calvum]MDC5695727.1 TetR/AcrR family transcriptional regulator [Intrasporangium calvum]